MLLIDKFICFSIFYLLTLGFFIFATRKTVDAIFPNSNWREKDEFYVACFTIFNAVMLVICVVVSLSFITLKDVLSVKDAFGNTLMAIFVFHLLHCSLTIPFAWKKMFQLFKFGTKRVISGMIFSGILSFILSQSLIVILA